MNKTAAHASKSLGEDEIHPQQVRRWVAKAQRGDEEAFGELMKTYHPRVFSLACGLVNNPDDAQDLAQQAWIKAWRNLPRYRQSAQFFTWMYRIVSNTCLDHLRHKARLREEAMPERMDMATQADPNLAPSRRSRPDREVERAELGRLFEAALKDLSAEHRLVLTLREVQGLSYEEIGQVIGRRKGTVMSRLFYARRHMQKKLRGLL